MGFENKNISICRWKHQTAKAKRITVKKSKRNEIQVRFFVCLNVLKDFSLFQLEVFISTFGKSADSFSLPIKPFFPNINKYCNIVLSSQLIDQFSFL